METNFTIDRGFGIAAAVVLSVEMILALIANSIVLLITITQRKSWKQSSTIFFTSLILAHLVMALLYMPLIVITLAAGGWIFGSTDEEKKGTCYFSVFIYWYTVLVISVTVAAISFDRFLFIVKPHLHKRFMRPWVALILTIIIWILAAPLSTVHFIRQYSLDYCRPTSSSISSTIYFILISSAIVGIIFVTSVWTFCFTCRFINNQSVTAGVSVYASRKKRLFGIFGSMLIVYIICFIPSCLHFILLLFIKVPSEGNAVGIICFLFITIANPILFRHTSDQRLKMFYFHGVLSSHHVCVVHAHMVFVITSNNYSVVVLRTV